MEVYELPKVQRNFAENLVQGEGLAQKAANDYREKKALYDNLSKSGASAFKEADKDLAASLRLMFDLVQDINAQKKQMTEASGDIASLSYQRAKVYSNEKEYPLITEALKRFESASKQLNQALLDYSRESNSMADTIATKKLYFTFDVAEFQARVQKSIATSQENQKQMQKEITRGEGILNNWTKPVGRAETEKIFEDMRGLASDYSLQAQSLSSISRDMQSATAGAARISSLEANWPQVQKLVSGFDTAIETLAKLNEKFQRKAEGFRNPSKRGP